MKKETVRKLKKKLNTLVNFWKGRHEKKRRFRDLHSQLKNKYPKFGVRFDNIV